MKAADQGLVEKMSFRFLITGEEADDHQQPHRSKYFSLLTICHLNYGDAFDFGKKLQPMPNSALIPSNTSMNFERFCSTSEL